MPQHHVTLKQISFAASVMIIGTSILTKQLYAYMGEEAWITVLSGFAFCLLFFLIYSSLARRFPGLSLIEMNDVVFGRIVGKIISVVYIHFFFTIACLNVNALKNILQGYMLPNTPPIMATALFVMVCTWAARKGPVSLLRYGVLLTVLSFTLLVTITSLLIPDIDFRKLLPVLAQPLRNYAVGTHSIAMVPLSDPFIMMMYLPHVKNTDGFGKAITKGLLIGTLFMLVIIIRDPAVLGPSLADYTLPTLISIRLIDVADVLTRIDIVYFFIIIILIFYKVSLLFYAAASGLQRLLKTDSEKFMIHILGVLLILYAITVFQSADEHSRWLVNGAAHVHHTFVVVVLPAATLITAALRGMTKEAARASQAADFDPAGGGA